MKTPRILVWLAGFSMAALLFGCSKPAESKVNSPSSEKLKACFNCVGTGKVPCPYGKDGLMDCPGPCLKLSQGTWEHMDVQGHPPTDVWRKFPAANGGYQAWNQLHVGDVIENQNGTPVNVGKCKICRGTGKVKCTRCNGTGSVDCPICEGKKVVPESWTAFDNPKLKIRPEHFQLKDGRVLVGKTVMMLGDSITIRTETTNITVKRSDLEKQSGGDHP